MQEIKKSQIEDEGDIIEKESREEIMKSVSRSFDDIAGIINIISISIKHESFKDWLKEYHDIQNTNNYFQGYTYFLETCYRSLIGNIINNKSMDLNEDFIFGRATHAGIDIEDIPQSCEKAILVKNMWENFTPIRKAKDWKQFENGLTNIKEIVFLFNKIIREYTSTNQDVNEEEIKKALSIIQLHLYFHDFDRAKKPYGHILGVVLEHTDTIERMEDIYLGFVYTLQYVWYQLLEDEFNDSVLSELHIIHKKRENDAVKRLQEKPGLTDSITKGKDTGKKKGKNEDKIFKLKNWFALDTLFGEVRNNIVKPKEEKYNLTYPFTCAFEKNKQIEKNVISDLLVKREENEPNYLNPESDVKLLKKKLNFYLFWDKVQILDTGKILDFNGTTAFFKMLNGCVSIKQNADVDKKIPVRIFKHPDYLHNGEKWYDYSFGIYIEPYDQSSGDSGWTIFYDCATDYSGHGSTLYKKAESAYSYFEENNEIKVKEMEIDKDVFKEVLKSKSVNSVFDTIKSPTPMGPKTEIDITKIKEELNQFIGDTKGKLFEYLFYRWFIESELENYGIENPDKSIKSINEKDVQIEFYVIHDKIDLFECKVKLHESDFRENNSIFRQLNEQKKELKRRYPNKEVSKNLVVYQKAKDEWEEKIKNEDIALRYYPFEIYLEECKNKEVQKLESILKGNIPYLSQEQSDDVKKEISFISEDD